MNKRQLRQKCGITALYFGIPTGGELTDDINTWAIVHEISYEKAYIECFETLVTKILNNRNDGKASYFDLLLSECFHRKVLAPKIGFSTHGEGIHLPILIIKGTTVLHEPSNQFLALTSKVIDHFGQTFSNEFDFEYFGHTKIASQNNKTKIDFLPHYDVTYTLNDVPHYYDGERFIKI